MRTLGSPSSPDLLKQTICSRPCGECAGSYCPFTEEKRLPPFSSLIHEYLILKEQKQYQEKNMRAISAMMREKLKNNWNGSLRRTIRIRPARPRGPPGG